MAETDAMLSHLECLAQRHFGLDALRPQQKNVFIALQQHRQVMAMLPTGAGKTLLYALGSLLFSESVTVVVCPLIALMRDQCRRMSEAGIPTVAIFSEQDETERRSAFRQILQGSTKLLFVSPERFCLRSFQKFLRRLKIGMVVVDEAHCVVTWGHSFRPEYSQLSQILVKLNVPRILALTATASRVSRDLIKEMVFPDSRSVFEVIDRPLKDNIKVQSIRVFSEDERWAEVQKILSEVKSEKTILYFTRREQCQRAAQELRKQGHNAVIYHAGLSKELRKSVEHYLHESDRKIIICATLAFGMGIDLPNVQLVIVVGFPGNIEEMFQMMGRAGRRGESAQAVLIWSGADPKKRFFQFEKAMPETSQLLHRVRQISFAFPGAGQSNLVPKRKLEQMIRPLVTTDKETQTAIDNLVSVFSMLGCGGAPELTRSDWVNVTVLSLRSFFNLLTDLPAGPSRRKMVMEWIQQRLVNLDSQEGLVRLCFPFSEIVEELQLTKSQIYEVLKYFFEKGLLHFDVVLQGDLQSSILVSGSLEKACASLPRYQKWRSALMVSLEALSTFVTAEQCRMCQCESLFLPRTGAVSRVHVAKCNRCDLCLGWAAKRFDSKSRSVAKPLTLKLHEPLR